MATKIWGLFLSLTLTILISGPVFSDSVSSQNETDAPYQSEVDLGTLDQAEKLTPHIQRGALDPIKRASQGSEKLGRPLSWDRPNSELTTIPPMPPQFLDASSRMQSALHGRTANSRLPVLFVPPLLGGIPVIIPRDKLYSKLQTAMLNDPQGWTKEEIFEVYISNSVASNAAKAQEIVDRAKAVMSLTGATQVDLISWSSGAIAVRYAIKYLGFSKYVHTCVFLSGTHHGTMLMLTDRLQFDGQAFGEVAYQSAFLKRLNESDPNDPNHYETFGPEIAYYNICSADDGIHKPWTSQLLYGANNLIIPNGFLRPLGHLLYPSYSIVIDLAILALKQDDAGLEKRLSEHAQHVGKMYNRANTDREIANYFGDRVPVIPRSTQLSPH